MVSLAIFRDFRTMIFGGMLYVIFHANVKIGAVVLFENQKLNGNDFLSDTLKENAGRRLWEEEINMPKRMLSH